MVKINPLIVRLVNVSRLFYTKSKIEPYKLQLSLELFGYNWIQVYKNGSKIK